VTTYLLDTNVVARLAAAADPQHSTVKNAVVALHARGDALVLAPQVLFEFWVVATRPVEVNGFGWSAIDTSSAIRGLQAQFTTYDDGLPVLERWLKLVEAHGVLGKRAHDAHLIAFMLVHGVPNVLTLNTGDFAGLGGISAVHPATIG
jgi:predicted nucleic acid-binding protein